MSENRRTQFRHVVDIAATIVPPTGAELPGRLGNLSLGGAFLNDYKLPMGKRLTVKFSIPTQEEVIETAATVRWTTDDGIGIQFDGLRARDVWALNKYFELLER